MKIIRVLVVDDSRLVRDVICEILSTDPGISVVGQAADGRDALQKVMALRPDLVTMDINMPVMDGLEAIEKIMSTYAVPILVVTSRGDAATAYNAISKGALEVIEKPAVNLQTAADFTAKVKLLSKIRVITHINVKNMLTEIKEIQKDFFPTTQKCDRIIAVASSTGGPQALITLLSALPRSLPCPVVIAQHISAGFEEGLASWLGGSSKLKIKVPVEGEEVLPGTAYIAPADRHMEVTNLGRISFKKADPKDVYHPSCNTLFTSVASAFGARAIGVILTGMGSDGVEGMRRIKVAGGVTIAQDEKSSVVFGMNRVAIEQGLADSVMPISDIAGRLLDTLAGKAPRREKA